jgi:hypothetical protein
MSYTLMHQKGNSTNTRDKNYRPVISPLMIPIVLDNSFDVVIP